MGDNIINFPGAGGAPQMPDPLKFDLAKIPDYICEHDGCEGTT